MSGNTMPDGAHFDVVVTGGGVSGAYSAWRLAQATDAGARAYPRIALLEAGERWGGRLHSITPPGMPHVRAELGGMRFLSTQLLILNLVSHLRLADRPFMASGDKNLFYLRRRHLRMSDFADPNRVPYRLAWNERGKRPGDLLQYAVETAIPRAMELTPSEWARAKREVQIEGRNLYNIGFWNLLHKILSSEGYNLVLDALGYHSIVSNWNAGEALQWLVNDFPTNVQYHTLRDGMDQIPKRLVEQFESEHGSGGLLRQVHLKHRLLKFRRRRPSAENGAAPALELLVERPDGSRARVTADHLILALPKRSIRLLQRSDPGNSLLNDPRFEANVDSVRAQPAYKLFLGYEYPWWRVLGLEHGRSGTDLPIRQTYYFETEGEQPEADRSNRNSLLMASYNDGMAVGFWDGFREDPEDRRREREAERRGLSIRNERRSTRIFEGRSNRFVTGPSYIDQFRVTEDLVQAAHNQLRLMHAIELFIPRPYTALFHDWRQDPFGGGWHFWKVGQEPWKVRAAMRRPWQAQGVPVYVCGEAWSSNQGWVEGALVSAEQMLQDHFGLRRPHWLPASYDLDPGVDGTPEPEKPLGVVSGDPLQFIDDGVLAAMVGNWKADADGRTYRLTLSRVQDHVGVEYTEAPAGADQATRLSLRGVPDAVRRTVDPAVAPQQVSFRMGPGALTITVYDQEATASITTLSLDEAGNLRHTQSWLTADGECEERCLTFARDGAEPG